MKSFPQVENDPERVAKAAWHDVQAQRLLPIVITAIVAAPLAGPVLIYYLISLYPNSYLQPFWPLLLVGPILAAWAVRRRRESHLRAAAGLRLAPAERVVEHAIKTNAPLVLFLRQFDLERQDLEAPGTLTSFGNDQIHHRSVVPCRESLQNALLDAPKVPQWGSWSA
jgi:hypothetical protein